MSLLKCVKEMLTYKFYLSKLSFLMVSIDFVYKHRKFSCKYLSTS